MSVQDTATHARQRARYHQRKQIDLQWWEKIRQRRHTRYERDRDVADTLREQRLRAHFQELQELGFPIPPEYRTDS